MKFGIDSFRNLKKLSSKDEHSEIGSWGKYFIAVAVVGFEVYGAPLHKVKARLRLLANLPTAFAKENSGKSD